VVARIVFLFLLLTSVSLADPFTKAERETGMPREILLAVARAESDLHPYAFAVWSKAPLPQADLYCQKRRFIGGKFLYNGCYFKTKKGALNFMNYLLSSPAVLNFSTGLMQVNSSWIKALDLNPAVLLDPETNVLIGALILKLYYEVEGDWTKALSRYYGKKSGIAWKYVRRVARNLQLAYR